MTAYFPTGSNTPSSDLLRRMMFFVVLFHFLPNNGFAQASCFSQAETYYEQVYCEVKGSGRGRSLPAFFEFKNNNQITQALLLKREAAAIGVVIKIPKPSSTNASTSSTSSIVVVSILDSFLID